MSSNIRRMIAWRKLCLVFCYFIWLLTLLPFLWGIHFIPEKHEGLFYLAVCGTICFVCFCLFVTLVVIREIHRMMASASELTPEEEIVARFAKIWSAIPDTNLTTQAGFVALNLPIPKILTRNYWFTPTPLIDIRSIEKLSDDEISNLVTFGLAQSRSVFPAFQFLWSRVALPVSLIVILGVITSTMDEDHLHISVLMLLGLYPWMQLTLLLAFLTGRIVVELLDLETVNITKAPNELIRSFRKIASDSEAPQPVLTASESSSEYRYTESQVFLVLSEIRATLRQFSNFFTALIPVSLDKAIETLLVFPTTLLLRAFGVKDPKAPLSLDEREAKLKRVHV